MSVSEQYGQDGIYAYEDQQALQQKKRGAMFSSFRITMYLIKLKCGVAQ